MEAYDGYRQAAFREVRSITISVIVMAAVDGHINGGHDGPGNTTPPDGDDAPISNAADYAAPPSARTSAMLVCTCWVATCAARRRAASSAVSAVTTSSSVFAPLI